MAFKLSKAQATERTAHVTAVTEAMAEYLNAREVLNEALEAFREWRDGSVETWREEWDSKNERWQEGDKGAAAMAWIEMWEGFDLSEIDEPELDVETFENITDAPEGSE